jgi:hypothetical protein
MKAFKEKGFAERRDAAAKANEDNLKKFSKKDQPADATPAAKKNAPVARKRTSSVKGAGKAEAG